MMIILFYRTGVFQLLKKQIFTYEKKANLEVNYMTPEMSLKGGACFMIGLRGKSSCNYIRAEKVKDKFYLHFPVK